jgi:hypothetical protein
MKNLYPLILLALLGCAPANDYQPSLDLKFSEMDGYQPGELTIKDTVTNHEYRERLLKVLRIRHPDDTSTLNELGRMHAAFLRLCNTGYDPDFCAAKFKDIAQRNAVAINQLAEIDSLEALIGGYDNNQIHDVTGFYKFKIGTDTFNYLVVFDGNKNIISADKR